MRQASASSKNNVFKSRAQMFHADKFDRSQARLIHENDLNNYGSFYHSDEALDLDMVFQVYYLL